MTLEVIAPAKVNTFLSVGPPDASGYHPLRSYFAAISLADTVRITPGTRMEITCNWPDLPAENTLTKVLRLLRELSEVPPCHIELIKAIPAESGLGGGSSDAAALLRGLHRLYPDHWPAEFMTAVAQAVGADVPFFLIGGLARAEGYGEKLTPLPDAPRRWLVVVAGAVLLAGCETDTSKWPNMPSSWMWLPRPFAVTSRRSTAAVIVKGT